MEKVLVSKLGDLSKNLEATVPCQELHRFLRLFDVEVVRITDQLRAMRNIQKEIPEVAQFSAEFQNSTKGDQPRVALTVLLSALLSHSLQADGVFRPLTTDAKAGKFSAVECIVKFNADLATLPDVSWSPPTVQTTLGRLDAEMVAQAAQCAQGAATQGSFCDVLAAAVQSMRRAAPVA